MKKREKEISLCFSKAWFKTTINCYFCMFGFRIQDKREMREGEREAKRDRERTQTQRKLQKERQILL